ncbi:biotin--[acetyl-CoA-carboxylase] ligase [Verminephrobacter aporrectodeae]|uniref:Biotin--[acetyl-CoA-carboxylase] ligase n=1 Tax=Verminephrobacter aporrectodeae subsp. tuberculatae TaxID=1110392 RepID=A0ABT3KZI7_9BURK|nr:biotin--[acetyl-CoA-carboxylase] ligase [Verminephrobacter aporrectodeae]MCW5323392.1 biotin--[acetyl-CoA-carboxylase] ligase [Verminephrobacter aporrectodeae subsp. tuberculatae]MCW8175103.1 biotin--[acetyl-CoA-carboxylase] ligase [Verminephrobacter aporrectodeae subsp. tuberculatae]MCW8202479.1 biotin--[acetyl-CoA-carboxylase] ligase [Verminephrobacter aporrectodeae subsp. tuberculatae]
MRWPVETLCAAVSPLLPGFAVEVLPSVDSTNTELMRRARAGRCAPSLLVAERQTAGRGRLGRVWHSDAAHGAGGAIPSLTMSLGLPFAPRDWSGLSLAVGVSVAESLQPVLPPRGAQRPARLGLKWPNDLWLDSAAGERKLGGILLETTSLVARGPAASCSAARYAVLGIGINVLPRSAEGLSLPPGSLQDLEPGLDAPAALLRIVGPLVAMLQAFEQHGFGPVQPRFAARDLLHGRAVALSDGRTGSAHGVREDGALLVRMAGALQAISGAEISVRPSAAQPV